MPLFLLFFWPGNTSFLSCYFPPPLGGEVFQMFLHIYPLGAWSNTTSFMQPSLIVPQEVMSFFCEHTHVFLLSDSTILTHFSISVSQDSFGCKWLNLTDFSEDLYILTPKTKIPKSNLDLGIVGFCGLNYALRLGLCLCLFPSLGSTFLCIGFTLRLTLSWWRLSITLSLK